MTINQNRDLDLAHALAGVLSGREFGELKIEVGRAPKYDPETDTLSLPGIPFGELGEDVKEDLRAYLGHEAIGERGYSTYKPKSFSDKGELAVVEGMNDARIDRIALREWPGSGMSIRSRVSEDWDYFKKESKAGRIDPTDASALGSALRYIGEGVATLDEVSKANPELGKVLRKAESVLKTVDWDASEKDIIEKAREVHRLTQLESHEEESQPESGEGEGEDGEGEESQPGEEGDGKPKPSSALGKEGKGEQETKSEKTSSPKGKPTGKPFGKLEDRLEERLKQNLDPVHCKRGKQAYTVPPGSLSRSTPSAKVNTDTDYAKPPRVAVSRIMRLFHQLQAAEDRVILRRRLTGELDPNRLADLHRGSQRLFSARKRGETESLAVYISVDLTGSISWRWHESLKQLVQVLNEALGRLDIPTAIVGWDGREPKSEWMGYTQCYGTRFQDMKTFEGRWQDAHHRIANTRAGSANADVMALSDAVSQLARRRESRKLVFYMTDGQPCLDYEGHRRAEEGLLGRTMQQVIAKGKRAGILTVAVGVGLGHYQQNTMDNIFGRENYVAIPRGYDLVAAIGPQFEKAIRRIVTQQEKGMR